MACSLCSVRAHWAVAGLLLGVLVVQHYFPLETIIVLLLLAAQAQPTVQHLKVKAKTI
jgi:hypothetical protein